MGNSALCNPLSHSLTCQQEQAAWGQPTPVSQTQTGNQGTKVVKMSFLE